MVLPGDGVGIENQLVLSLQIVKNRHLTVSHDNQLLLFEGMQP